MSCDVLVISAHPDDAELACSGTVKKLTNEGRSVAFADCTLGEAGTRGSADLRKSEAEASRKILGVSERVYLDMPDGAIEHTQENVLKVVGAIRHFQPRLIIIPPSFERHPDHETVYRIARTASFTAGLTKVITTFNGMVQQPHRPQRTICYQLFYDFTRQPDFYVDISDTFAYKMQSIHAFASQFHSPGESQSKDPETFISDKTFIEGLEARARYFGNRIGTRYAEAFLSIEPLSLPSLSLLL
ncbi:MAG: bacillithiol biosynthesis deacetylase BshB1 [Ignavibacteria bacterium]|nr:bacillithiol biosynthesis deacetylase BshB1 [Ignavibacteria bacterium]